LLALAFNSANVLSERVRLSSNPVYVDFKCAIT